jgi:hypothetical protein
VDVRNAHHSPLRRKSLSTRLSISQIDEEEEREDEKGELLDLPNRPLKMNWKGCSVSDVISEAVAENMVWELGYLWGRIWLMWMS